MDPTLLGFAAVVFVTAATPGPTVIVAFANGSRFGFRRAVYGMVGAGCSDIALIVAAAIGLGAVLAASAFWFAVVKWVGVVYLAWLGIQLLRAGTDRTGRFADANDIVETSAGTPLALFRRSFLVAVTNPKGYLFVAALLPQFVDGDRPLAGQYATLAIVFVAVDFAVMALYAAAGSGAVRALKPYRIALLERCSGIVLLGLSGGLALYRRNPS